VKLLFLALAGLKFGKVGLTAGSMVLSLAVYASIWGWPFAAGFVALLFAHEMGHVGAAVIRGLPVSAPAFIPFMGAFITMKQAPPDVETEAYVAYGGPFIGTLATFAVYFWARSVDSNLGLAVAYSGFFLNLFNLLPISPLDGGPLMIGLLLYRPSPMLFVIALVAAPHVMAAWRYDPSLPENQAYYGIPGQTKFEYAVLYLGLAALLAIMTFNLHDMLTSVHGGD